jgi:hypothetical protein
VLQRIFETGAYHPHWSGFGKPRPFFCANQKLKLRKEFFFIAGHRAHGLVVLGVPLEKLRLRRYVPSAFFFCPKLRTEQFTAKDKSNEAGTISPILSFSVGGVQERL